MSKILVTGANGFLVGAGTSQSLLCHSSNNKFTAFNHELGFL